MNNFIWLPVDVSKNNWTYGKQYRPRSDAAFCGVWSGSTLFAYAFVHLFLWLNFADQIKVHHNFEWCLLRCFSLSIWLFDEKFARDDVNSEKKTHLLTRIPNF